MKILKPNYIDNIKSLNLLWKNSPLCRPYVQKIRRSYQQYLQGQARPDLLDPVGLPPLVVDELYSFYKGHRKRDGLQWIDTYRGAPDLSHCPLCGNSGPSQLEHYLPRSPYAEFSTFSWNLIPSCGLCNGKRGKNGNAPGQKIPLIHPYFDESIYGQSMLSARILINLDSVKFEPVAIGPFNINVLERIERQIGCCINLERFNAHLVSKWNIWRGKASVYGTPKQIKEHLRIELEASVGPTGKNSWDVAFLRALLTDGDALQWLAINQINLSSAPFPVSNVV